MVFMYDLYQQPLWMIGGLVIVSAWTLVWKGLGLWHAGQFKQKKWFIAMLILNTAGLLPIIYLLWFKPQKPSQEQTQGNKKQKKRPKINKRKIKKQKPTS
jgi:hypothetical protein